MAAGKQTEATIVHWHPSEATGYDGTGATGATIPDNESNADSNTALLTASGYTDALRARLVASGVLPN